MLNYKTVKKGLALPIVLVIVAVVLVTGATATGVYLVTQNQQNERNKDTTQANTPTLSVNTEENAGDVSAPTTTLEATPTEVPPTSTTTPTPTPTQMTTQTTTPTPTKVQVPTVTATPTKKPTRYTDAPKPGGFNPIDTELQVTATRVSNGIRLTWSKCNSDQFVAYKIARSETASDVYFPRDGAIASIPNVNTLSYTDTSVNPGTTYYYRVCSLESDGSSWCGNVVTVSY